MSHQFWTTLIKHSISPNQLYFIDCCRNSIQPSGLISPGESIVCEKKGFIDAQGNVTSRGLMILEEFETLLKKTKNKVAGEVLGEDYMSKVSEYRESFPPRRLPSGELARQSINELKDKFVWFFKTYPQYDWELVLDATDYYIHLYGLQNFQYMACSTYFIKKTNMITKEVSSKLADYCQQILEDPALKKLDN